MKKLICFLVTLVCVGVSISQNTKLSDGLFTMSDTIYGGNGSNDVNDYEYIFTVVNLNDTVFIDTFSYVEYYENYTKIISKLRLLAEDRQICLNDIQIIITFIGLKANGGDFWYRLWCSRELMAGRKKYGWYGSVEEKFYYLRQNEYYFGCPFGLIFLYGGQDNVAISTNDFFNEKKETKTKEQRELEAKKQKLEYIKTFLKSEQP